jgi:RHS repeat-associated protein
LVNGSATWQYSYDYENRLTGVTKNNVTVQTNTYDSDGRRVKSVQGGATTVYIYEGTNLIYQKNTGSGAANKYYYANGLMLEQGCECGYSYYYVNDALGSVRVVMQGSSNTLFSSNYKPFGLSYGQHGASFFQYTGKPIDPSTGLYYFGARFYAAALERFITEDTYPGVREDPQSLNRYVYVENNPVSYSDPTGHSSTAHMSIIMDGSDDSSSGTTSSYSVSGGFVVTTTTTVDGYTTTISTFISTSSSAGGGSSVIATTTPTGTTDLQTMTTSSSGTITSTSASVAPDGAVTNGPTITSSSATSAGAALGPVAATPASQVSSSPGASGCSLRPAVCPSSGGIQLSLGEVETVAMAIGLGLVGGAAIATAAILFTSATVVTFGVGSIPAAAFAAPLLIAGGTAGLRSYIILLYAARHGAASNPSSAWSAASNWRIP